MSYITSFRNYHILYYKQFIVLKIFNVYNFITVKTTYLFFISLFMYVMK